MDHHQQAQIEDRNRELINNAADRVIEAVMVRALDEVKPVNVAKHALIWGGTCGVALSTVALAARWLSKKLGI